MFCDVHFLKTLQIDPPILFGIEEQVPKIFQKKIEPDLERFWGTFNGLTPFEFFPQCLKTGTGSEFPLVV